jgi:hypothetical protein
MSNNVNHPEHYQNIAGVEAIDILNDVVKDLPGTQAALLWNALKYQFRFQKKNGPEDLKKAQNYLQYLIDDMTSTQDTGNKEILWDTWFSNEYGNMTIFAKSKEPNGMPSKLVFESRDAAEEFQSVVYNMISEGYTEFSIADAALEMKFKITKGNKWNKWDELVYWDRVLDNLSINEDDGKYELIFNYKTQDSCVIYESNDLGHVEVYHSANMYPGACTTILFDSRAARKRFSDSFFKRLTSTDYKPFSIRDVLSDISVPLSEAADCFSKKVQWKDIFTSFALTKKDGNFALVFYYKNSNSKPPKEIKTEHGPCVIYESKISGHAEVYYSTQMYPGTCVTIAFTSELVRDMFISNFFNKFKKNKFSIRDVLADTNFIDPDGTDNFSTELPWKDLFAKFRLRSIKDKYFLDLVYKKDALDTLEEMQATSDKCNLYKSTVWGSVEVYYSTDMPEGTCTKLLFDDKGGRDTFAIKFFRYLSYNSHRFSIRDILEETKFMFSKEDDNLSVTIPWNEVFKGFHITDEAGKYALEFIIDLQGGK